MMSAGKPIQVQEKEQMEMMGRVHNVVIPDGDRRFNDTTEEFYKNKKSAIISAKRFVCCGFPARLWITLAALSLMCLGALPARAQESSDQKTSEIAKQAQNPIANVISVPLENDFYPHTGVDKEDSYVLEMKPVVPFKLSNDWNLITRTVIPVAQVPDLAPGVSGASGLGDVQTSLFFSPAKVGKVIWGAGPVVSSSIFRSSSPMPWTKIRIS
jgi:hypothetical protein